MAASPPVVDGSKERNVVEQRVYGANLGLLRLKSVALDDWRELNDSGHHSWKSRKDRKDGAVVGQYREGARLNRFVQRLDYWVSDAVRAGVWIYSHTAFTSPAVAGILDAQ